MECDEEAELDVVIERERGDSKAVRLFRTRPEYGGLKTTYMPLNLNND